MRYVCLLILFVNAQLHASDAEIKEEPWLASRVADAWESCAKHIRRHPVFYKAVSDICLLASIGGMLDAVASQIYSDNCPGFVQNYGKWEWKCPEEIHLCAHNYDHNISSVAFQNCEYPYLLSGNRVFSVDSDDRSDEIMLSQAAAFEVEGYKKLLETLTPVFLGERCSFALAKTLTGLKTCFYDVPKFFGYSPSNNILIVLFDGHFEDEPVALLRDDL